MGQPKKQRRKYSRPQNLFKVDRIEEESEIIKNFGLKNNKEVWKAKSEVGRLRTLARSLLAHPDEKTTADFLGRLKGMGLLTADGKLEDVLKLRTEDILERRLQTQVYRKNLSLSVDQARQFIIHGHIAVNGQRMTVPGHLLTKVEEESISFYGNSSLSNPEHPMRKVEKKAVPEKRQERVTRDKWRKGKRPRQRPRSIIQKVLPVIANVDEAPDPGDVPLDATEEIVDGTVETEEVKPTDKTEEVKETTNG
ncbi:MAG: 30S ribosomal protein S4 [Candidatus Altiarchaeota archaeon]|nr:30S ribosomal protein S4 [Candidatus Altiarchaeota archaeon]